MTTELQQHIQNIAIHDTHEHLNHEQDWLHGKEDIFQILFGAYLPADLRGAGLRNDAWEAVFSANDPGDYAKRWDALKPSWERCKHTGYGEAARYAAESLFGMAEITAAGLEAADRRLRDDYRKPGERLRVLRDVAGLDHVQVDDFVFACRPDASGPDFFLYDLSMVAFCSGKIQRLKRGITRQLIREESGIEVKDLATLADAQAALFEKYAPVAVAVKSQHAYERTLVFEPRDEADAARALEKVLTDPESEDDTHRLCVGDFCLEHTARLCAKHNLPFKIHTGYHAGTGYMRLPEIDPAPLYKLFARHPQTKFVLMHMAYPYNEAVVALAKHYGNVYADLCWAWSINPYTSADLVRRFIHAVPRNKLFGFGGDQVNLVMGTGYALQARKWMHYALRKEVDESLLTETEAMAYATAYFAGNQSEVFDYEGTRGAIRAAL